VGEAREGVRAEIIAAAVAAVYAAFDERAHAERMTPSRVVDVRGIFDVGAAPAAGLLRAARRECVEHADGWRLEARQVVVAPSADLQSRFRVPEPRKRPALRQAKDA